MLNNWLSLDDVLRAAEKLKQGYGHRLVRLFWPSTANNRVRTAWQHVDSSPRSWADIPAVKKLWASRITGNPDSSIHRFIADNFLKESGNVRALSVGCGTGANEVKWIRENCFSELIGLDISPSRIKAAQSRARDAQLDARLHFRVADARTLESPSGSFDVVLAESALHHMSPLAPSVAEIDRVLRPGGLVILRDFVGPSRFQWTKEQLNITNGLLQVIPPSLRIRPRSGSIKKRFFAQSRLAMILSDPSEAAESSKILSIMENYFECVFQRPLGGTILQLVFDEIAANFLTPTPDTVFWTDTLLDIEKHLIDQGHLPSDFIFAVYRKPVEASHPTPQ